MPGNPPSLAEMLVAGLLFDMTGIPVFPRPAGRNPKTNALHQLHDGSAGQCPFTLGGDMFTLKRIAPLREEHLNQTDTKFNERIWSIIPVEMGYEFGKKAKKLEDELNGEWNKYVPISVIARNDPAHRVAPTIAPGTVAHEKWRIWNNSFRLELLKHTLELYGFIHNLRTKKTEGQKERTANGKRNLEKVPEPSPKPLPAWWTAPASTPKERKANNTAEPFNVLIKRIGKKKNIITKCLYNTRDYGAAAREYLYCIFELYPWVASPLLFTPHDAFASGLAQLENELYIKLSLSCYKLYEQTKDYEVLMHARDFAEHIVSMRYTTHDFLAQAWHVMYNAYIGEHKRDGMPMSFYPSPAYCPAARANDALVLHIMIKAESPGDGSWVHSKCYETHVCGESFQKYAEDKVAAEVKRRQEGGARGGLVRVSSTLSVPVGIKDNF